jgi:hypothetical protein
MAPDYAIRAARRCILGPISDEPGLQRVQPLLEGRLCMFRHLGMKRIAHHAVVADAFDAFKSAASTPFAGGNTCKAGLLNASPQNQFLCDVHPSQSGQQLLAHTVENTYAAATGD